MSLCISVECNRKLYAKTFCRMHYKRFNKHGDYSIVLKSHHNHVTKVHEMKERFNKLIDKKDIFSCWEWKGNKNKQGYGAFNLHTGNKKYKKVVASRMSYEYYYGEIPDGLFVCHHCDNPSCVNPKHLFLGSQKDNLRNMSLKNRSLSGEKNPKSKFTNEFANELRSRLALGSQSMSSIAKELGVSESTIKRIKYNKSYANKECDANTRTKIKQNARIGSF